MIEDTTECKRAEEALRDSEARYRAFIARSAECIAHFGVDPPIPVATPVDEQVELLFSRSHLVECNDACARMHGRTLADQVSGTPLERLISPADPVNVEQMRTFVRSGYRLVDEERSGPDAQGQTLWFCRSMTGVTEDGFLVEVWAVERDITERRRMQQQLRSAAGLWQATFDAVPHQIMILDRASRIRQANAAAAAFLGLPASELVGRPCHVLMHGAGGCIDGCPATRAFLTRAHAETEIFHPGKSVWLWVSADPILDAEGNMTGVVHTVRDVTDRKNAEEERRQVFEEVQRLRDRLHQENVYLRQEVKGLDGQPVIVAQSAAMRRVLAQAEQVASTGSSVLLLGETGTGKDRLAAYIHSLSPRRDRTMVRVSCSAIPTALMESELFGREKGAYTGALSKQVGRFELAHGSTLFLDEIGELPSEVQVKLLQVLQEKQIERLGSPKPIPVDVRIIAATNRNLEEGIRSGRFREDLYYRLNVFPIVVPPLRERREDIPLLVRAFVDELATTIGKRVESISKGSLDRLTRHAWPGNVRELRNVIERAMILCAGPTLNVDLPSRSAVVEASTMRAIDEVQRQHILRVLEQTGWRVRGTHGAADILGMKPSTLESRMKKLGVRRPRH